MGLEAKLGFDKWRQILGYREAQGNVTFNQRMETVNSLMNKTCTFKVIKIPGGHLRICAETTVDFYKPA